MRRQLRFVVVVLKLQIFSLFSSSTLSNRFLLARAQSTNLFDSTCEISAPSSVRLAAMRHSQRFFSGWNCTAKMGQSLDSRAETKVSPCGEVVVEATRQKLSMRLFSRKLESLTPTSWLKQRMPVPVVSLLLRFSLRSSKRTDFSTNLSTLSMWSEPRMGCRMFSSKPEVRQLSSYSPRQVPQTGKMLPRLFSAIANCRMKLAFLTQWLSMWISSSPAPPVKSTPLTFLRRTSMSDWLEKAQMGTTCAPDIQTYLTQAAEMQVLSSSLVDGSSYSSICVQTPITGFWGTVALRHRPRRIASTASFIFLVEILNMWNLKSLNRSCNEYG